MFCKARGASKRLLICVRSSRYKGFEVYVCRAGMASELRYKEGDSNCFARRWDLSDINMASCRSLAARRDNYSSQPPYMDRSFAE